MIVTEPGVYPEMRSLDEFDDPGADEYEPAKGVMIGNIRQWIDEIEALKASYDKLLITWAECRDLLTAERLKGAKLREDYARLDAKFETYLKYGLAE